MTNFVMPPVKTFLQVTEYNNYVPLYVGMYRI